MIANDDNSGSEWRFGWLDQFHLSLRFFFLLAASLLVGGSFSISVVQAMEARNGEGVRVFEHFNYGGQSLVLPEGRTSIFMLEGDANRVPEGDQINFTGINFNDRISSLRIPPGYTVIAYTDWKGQGEQFEFTSDTDRLPPNANDRFSSFDVIRKKDDDDLQQEEVATGGDLALAQSTCMGCHNGSLEMDYAGAGIENPHPFAPVQNMSCVTCHGGNNQATTRDGAHIPAPPEFRDDPNQPSLSQDRLIDDAEAYFNRLTLAGMDKYPDYEWEGQTYTAIDYLQFINPGDMRVVNEARSCGTVGCHDDMAKALSANPFGFETGFLSGIGFSTGMENKVNEARLAIDSGVSPAVALTQADYAFRAVNDPNFNFLEGAIGSTKVGSVEEVPVFGRFNVAQDIKTLEDLDADEITKFIANDKNHKNYIKSGTPLEKAMREMVNITCGDCHAGSSGANNRFADFRASGCTGCHMPYSRDGIGRSQDPWVGLGDIGAVGRSLGLLQETDDYSDWAFSRNKNKNKNKDKDEVNVGYQKSEFLGVVRNPDAIDANFGEIPGVVSHRIASAATTLRADGSTNDPVTDDACAGCHQGSNRTALQFWGIRLDQNQDLVNGLQYPLNPVTFETAANNPRIFDPQVNNQTFNGRVAEQLIEFEDYDGDGRDDTPPDIHFERGMGCIDCHGSRDVHGANTRKVAQETAGIPSRQSQHTKVQCQTCHGGVNTYAETASCIDINGVQAECAVDESGTVMDHVRWDAESGVMRLTSRLTGNDHIVPQTRDSVVNNGKVNPITNEPFYNEKASIAMGRADGDANTGIGPVQEDGTLVSQGFSHTDDLDCAACHASWNNTCIGCHLGLGTDLDPDNNDFFSNITGEKIALFQANADFTYQNPFSTFNFVEATGKINRTSAGMKMFFRFFDKDNNQSDTMAFSDRLGNGNNPGVDGRDKLPALGHDQITAHSIRGAPTNDKEGNAYCVTCHLTKDGMKEFGKEYNDFVKTMEKGDYEDLDFALLAQHIGGNTQNQLNSPFFVHMATGLGTGLFLFDEDGCPVNPLDNNANRAGCDGVAPATRWAEFIAGDRDLKYNLDANVEWTGVSNGSSSNPMLSGSASSLRDGANFPEMAGPMGARLVNKLANPKTGLVLDSWMDADGKLRGKMKKTVENLVLIPVNPDLEEILPEEEVVEEVVEEVEEEEQVLDLAQLLAEGRTNWDTQCAVCHGANGEGGLVDPTPVLPGVCDVPEAGGCEDFATLVEYISLTMPSPVTPCVDLCAESTAALIFSFAGLEAEIVPQPDEVVEQEQEQEVDVVIEEEVNVEEEQQAEEEPIDPAELLAAGRTNWDAQCAFCHGNNGEGAFIDPSPVAPGLCTVPTAGGCQDLDTLAAYIAGVMPTPAAPCTGDCAISTAALILSFDGNAAAAAPAKDKESAFQNPFAR